MPDDLAIVGYDDIEFAAAAAVPLTSVRQPRAQLGMAAMELLMEEATDRKAHQHRQIVFEPELVVRESSSVQPRRSRRSGPARKAAAAAATGPRRTGQPPPAGRRAEPVRISLFVTCLADTLFPQVGKATVTLLERLGHQVEFPAEQSCCGTCM